MRASCRPATTSRRGEEDEGPEEGRRGLGLRGTGCPPCLPSQRWERGLNALTHTHPEQRLSAREYQALVPPPPGDA